MGSKAKGRPNANSLNTFLRDTGQQSRSNAQLLDTEGPGIGAGGGKVGGEMAPAPQAWRWRKQPCLRQVWLV